MNIRSLALSSNPSPRILLVGAYERDNVGDLLFLIVTERYLPGAGLYAAAPFHADMTQLLGRDVRAYGPLLRHRRFDAIWTVGGQVGGISVAGAYRLSAPRQAYDEYVHGSERTRQMLLRRAAGGSAPLSPYIPSPLAYPRNAGTPTILNSVGLAGIARARPDRRAALIRILRGTDVVSVRDRESSTYLGSLGIDHRLEPDAVHAIGAAFPARDKDEDVAVIQFSGRVVRAHGHAEIASALAASATLRRMRLRFLAAGTASGHDSFDDFHRIIGHLRTIVPGVDAAVLDDRRPTDIAGHIQRATVVVGSSLHMRIVACAYGVARVSLRRAKTTNYARWWDDAMPFDVTFDKLDDAIVRALAAGRDAGVRNRSEALTRRADENLKALGRFAGGLAASENRRSRSARAANRRRIAAREGTSPAGEPDTNFGSNHRRRPVSR